MWCWHSLVLGLGLVTGVAAQRTWIVDAANPPGTDFTDIPPAEAAAADGDTLLVRSGTYSAFTTGKAIAVLGVPGGTLVVGLLASPAITVSGLPADKVFRARGLVFGGSFNQSVFVHNNLGAVHLEEIDAAGPTHAPPYSSIAISSSRVVTLVGCGHQSVNLSVNVHGSRVVIVRCRLYARSALSDPRAGSWSASAALNLVSGAVVDVADCELRGGAGASIWPHVGGYWPSAPAVVMNIADLRLRAGAVATVSAGVGVNPATPMPAISGTGTAQIDNRVTLISYAGAPLIEAGVQATIGLVPGLSLVGGALGGNLVLTHHGQANQACVLALGFVGTVLSFPFGDLYLDLATMQLLPTVFADGTGVATWTVPVPFNPALAGAAFTWQVGSDAGRLVLSNPASVILR